MSWFDDNAPNDTTAPGPGTSSPVPSGPGVPYTVTGPPKYAPGVPGGNMPVPPTGATTGPNTPMAPTDPNTSGSFPTTAQGWQSYSGDPHDPKAIAAYVQWLSQQPGADPSLASDPNYWIGKISTDGLTSGNVGYWNTRSMAGAGNNFGSLATGFTQPFTGDPTKTYTPPASFQFTPFKAPTADEALNNPGYQFALSQGLGAIQNSAAAKGNYFTPNTLEALNNYAQGAATQNYQQVFNNDLSSWNQNFMNNLGAYTTNANIGKGAFDTNYTNAFNEYLTAANIFNTNSSNLFNRNFSLATLGQNAATAGGA